MTVLKSMPSAPTRSLVAVAAIGVSAIGGCAAPRGTHGAATSKHVVLFPGISGADPAILGAKWMIESEVAGASAEVLDWTGLVSRRVLLGNLMDSELNRARARAISDRLQTWRTSHPDVPLYLLGLSGGAGIVLLTCDELPDDFRVERIILLSGAISADYDLTRALRMSRQGIVSYSSELDAAILNLGTRVFGTLDRRRVASAGYGGFSALQTELAGDKLLQVRWAPEDVQLGNFGGHLGSLVPAYFRKKILPFVDGKASGTARRRSSASSGSGVAGQSVAGPKRGSN